MSGLTAGVDRLCSDGAPDFFGVVAQITKELEMNQYCTKEDFEHAPLGHAFMEACHVCGQETGSISIKTKNYYSRPVREHRSASIPRLLINPESECEFCEFLGLWFAHENIEPKETGLQYGVAKLVEVVEDSVTDADGKAVFSQAQKLLAYVPFQSDEDLDRELIDGTKFRIQHRAVIRCERQEDGSAHLVEILDRGI